MTHIWYEPKEPDEKNRIRASHEANHAIWDLIVASPLGVVVLRPWQISKDRTGERGKWAIASQQWPEAGGGTTSFTAWITETIYQIMFWESVQPNSYPPVRTCVWVYSIHARMPACVCFSCAHVLMCTYLYTCRHILLMIACMCVRILSLNACPN